VLALIGGNAGSFYHSSFGSKIAERIANPPVAEWEFSTVRMTSWSAVSASLTMFRNVFPLTVARSRCSRLSPLRDISFKKSRDPPAAVQVFDMPRPGRADFRKVRNSIRNAVDAFKDNRSGFGQKASVWSTVFVLLPLRHRAQKRRRQHPL